MIDAREPSQDRPRILTVLSDFVLALVVFAIAVSLLNVSGGHAFPAPPPAELLPAAGPTTAAFVPALSDVAPTPRVAPGVPQHMLSLLAVSFAALVAFNLAMLRHLRSAYASPRRRS